MNGKHIELFLVNGVAGELTTVEIAGWTGHVLTGRRNEFSDAAKREEGARNGTYILLGSDSEAIDGLRVYIGKTEHFAKRLADHNLTKDFWDRFIIISAKDSTFNEGHWGYLESRLVDEAAKAERCTLENTQTPQERKLSEAQRSDMEAFLEQVKVILPVLGVNILRNRKAKQEDSSKVKQANASDSPRFHYRLKKVDILAHAQVVDGEFLLLEGSQVTAGWQGRSRTESTQRSYSALQRKRAELEANGSITVNGAIGTVTRDIPCNSPSQAGSIVSGRSSNGRTEWKWDDNGVERTYADWEERGLNVLDVVLSEEV